MSKSNDRPVVIVEGEEGGDVKAAAEEGLWACRWGECNITDDADRSTQGNSGSCLQ